MRSPRRARRSQGGRACRRSAGRGVRCARRRRRRARPRRRRPVDAVAAVRGPGGTCRPARRGSSAPARRRPAAAWLARAAHRAAIRAGMSPPRSSELVVGVEQRHVGGAASRRAVCSSLVVVVDALGAPHAAALLDEPQAHHVAQQADGVAHAALVGEVEAAASGPRLGVWSDLDAQQRPGARREHRGVAAARSGAAANADAVSWPATVRTGAPPTAPGGVGVVCARAPYRARTRGPSLRRRTGPAAVPAAPRGRPAPSAARGPRAGPWWRRW